MKVAVQSCPRVLNVVRSPVDGRVKDPLRKILPLTEDREICFGKIYSETRILTWHPLPSVSLLQDKPCNDFRSFRWQSERLPAPHYKTSYQKRARRTNHGMTTAAGYSGRPGTELSLKDEKDETFDLHEHTANRVLLSFHPLA
jgi:hypothetical protein